MANIDAAVERLEKERRDRYWMHEARTDVLALLADWRRMNKAESPCNSPVPDWIEKECSKLSKQQDAMRAVCDAAEKWRHDDKVSQNALDAELEAAVDALRKTRDAGGEGKQ